jgi:hypothetical protein
VWGEGAEVSACGEAIDRRITSALAKIRLVDLTGPALADVSFLDAGKKPASRRVVVKD